MGQSGAPRRYEYRILQTGSYGPLHFAYASLAALRRRIEYVRGTDGRVKIKPVVQRREVSPWVDWKDAADV